MANEDNPNVGNPVDPFALRAFFPDAQGIFDAQYKPLEIVKVDCFVALDANVLLLPYKLENVSLPDVLSTYRQLANEKRLIIPAQAAREFARHRSMKVAEVVQHLRTEAAKQGPQLAKKIGALIGNVDYESAKSDAVVVSEKVKALQKVIARLADKVADHVGEDPVSIGYREVFSGAVRDDPESCLDKEEFLADLRARFAQRRPPGYKDTSKPDGGGGDLIIWKTILAEGNIRKSDCIFVTADEKSDWYVQASGPFQPRLELMEEYRAASGGTLHILPLSRLLQLFEAPPLSIEDVKRAETDALRSKERPRELSGKDLADALTRRELSRRFKFLDTEIDSVLAAQSALPPATGNMHLPWERELVRLDGMLSALMLEKEDLLRKIRSADVRSYDRKAAEWAIESSGTEDYYR